MSDPTPIAFADVVAQEYAEVEVLVTKIEGMGASETVGLPAPWSPV